MLRSKILKKFLLVLIILVVGYTTAIVFIVLPQVDSTIKKLEEQNAKEILDKVVLLTDNVAKNLDSLRNILIYRHKEELKNITDVVSSMMNEMIIQTKSDPTALEKRKALLLKHIRNIRYGDNNYFFVVDYNGTILSHPYIKKGTDMHKILDIKGKAIVPQIIDVARKNGEGFTHYWWKKNNGEDKPYEKLTYSRNCPSLKIIVATGIYIHDIEEEIQKRKEALFSELKMIMKKTRIGKTGYIYIFDKHKMIIHPNDNINSENFKKMPNPGNGTLIYDDLVKAAKGSGVLRYKWDKPTDKGNFVYDKISWIRYVPSMDLYVVSSAYVSELEAIAVKLHNKIILFGLVILLFTLLLSMYYLRKLLIPVCELTQTVNEITQGNYSIRAKVTTDDEIAILAKNFNLMVDRLEEQIRTLDQKVQEKTLELKYLAITDSLTGLYNRRYFAEIASEIFELGKREHETISMIMLDIDKFKKINDTYGHQAGDKVIIALAKILHDLKRESDVACRYGGEEFVLLLPKTHSKGAFILAERIRKMVEQFQVSTDNSTHIQFTVSLGVSEVDYHEDANIESLIRRSDNAMYQAKKEGRNRTCSL
jgi:diguanylate cyclase (GGDEF)-like protein